MKVLRGMYFSGCRIVATDRVAVLSIRAGPWTKVRRALAHPIFAGDCCFHVYGDTEEKVGNAGKRMMARRTRKSERKSQRVKSRVQVRFGANDEYGGRERHRMYIRDGYSAVSAFGNPFLFLLPPTPVFHRQGRLVMNLPHQHQPHDRPRIPRKRRRLALSCIECRRRKVRCDRDQPCHNCRASLAQCVYETYANSEYINRQPPATSSPSTAGPGNHVAAPTEYSRDGFATGGHAQHTNYPIVSQIEAAAAGETTSPHNFSSNPARSSHGATGSGLDLRYQLLKDRPADPPLQPGLDESGWHILKQQVGLKDSDVPLNKHRPPRWSEWLGTAPEVWLINDYVLTTLY